MPVRTRTVRPVAAVAALTFAAALAVPTASASAAERGAPGPKHPSSAALAGVDYATWQRDVAPVVARARTHVAQRTAGAPSGERRAIVLDIDNTSLETDFHPFWEYPTDAIAPMLELARFADSRDVAVFFVTARPGIIQGLTEYNLKKVGYPVDGLYVQRLPDLFHEVSRYKTAKRAEIEAKGYTIIANIGNRPTDLVGGHAERTFKLPDYGGKLT
ncbi:HAD family acid phosphatase [Streptomyces sp. NPDC017979]|uniref:HAD family acid phosphatase n=1 Tax=Streptomyces sp. NPDC017979 TaxID=3365024 RepID=UPI00378BB812